MTTETKPRFTNIAEIKRANKAAGFYWFSPSTVRTFASRVESRIFDNGRNERLWVESTTNYDDSAREYKIAVFTVDGSNISWLMTRDYAVLRFRTKNAALEALEGAL
jgi:hypothetical protein